MKLAGYPVPLAEGTPGLVWDVEGTSAVFVTFDGQSGHRVESADVITIRRADRTLRLVRWLRHGVVQRPASRRRRDAGDPTA